MHSSIVNYKFWTKVNTSSPELKNRNTDEQSENLSNQTNITIIRNLVSNHATLSIERYEKSKKKIMLSKLFSRQVFEAQLDPKTNMVELDLKSLSLTTVSYMKRVHIIKQQNTDQILPVKQS